MNSIEILRWLVFGLLMTTIIGVIALVLSLIVGLIFALMYLVPNGFWTMRYHTLLLGGLAAVPAALLLMALLIALDRWLEKQRKPHFPLGEDE
ncbi:MAG: hypothetical protein HXY40_03365 [Chloroflexi bacterium]|nr:hypothetical protein [Chloroflexota bacterium]